MLQLDFYSTLVAASLVLLLGRGLVARIGFLRTYNIPEPVAGGLLVAMLLLALRGFADIEVRFDPSLQTPLMLAFFATIGLNADFASLKKGGRILSVFLLVVTGLLVVQNAMGIATSKAAANIIFRHRTGKSLAKLIGIGQHFGTATLKNHVPVIREYQPADTSMVRQFTF